MMTRHLADEAATLDLGRALFRSLAPGSVIFLHGNLGAGKTTLVRGFLRAAGYHGPAKSPTFTLVEEYRLASLAVYHFDLYRLQSAEELECLGFRDYLRADALCFIEWPEHGEGALPLPDLTITLEISGPGRLATLSAASASGQRTLADLES